MNEWRKVKLGDIIEFIDGDRGNNYPTTGELTKEGYCLFLNAKNVTNFGFKFDENKFISKEKDDILRKGKLKVQDIVITTRGTIGNVAIFTDNIPYKNIRINSGMVILRICNNEKILNDFLYQILKSKKFKEKILNLKTGTAQPQLPISILKEIVIKLPVIKIQEKIAKILSDIDEKIELNNKINDNLEKLCQNYFLEIFIKNSNKNCLTGTISDLGNIVSGSTPSKKISTYYTNLGIPWITPKDLSKSPNKFISRGELDITELGFKNSSVKLLPKGSVLFSSRAPIGYIAICTNNVTTNQGFKSIIPFKNIGTEFTYYFLKNNIQSLENRASGSTFKEISTTTMETTPAIIPKEKSLNFFKEICSPIFKKQYIIEKENEKLTNLKNYLLPKLMNGEIDVENIEL